MNLINEQKIELITQTYNIETITKTEVCYLINIVNEYYLYVKKVLENINKIDFYFEDGDLINNINEQRVTIKNRVSKKTDGKSDFIFDFNDVFRINIENNKINFKISPYLGNIIRPTELGEDLDKDAKKLVSYISKTLRKEIKKELVNSEKIKEIIIVGNYLIELKKIKKLILTKIGKEKTEFLNNELLKYKFNFDKNNEEYNFNELKDIFSLTQDINLNINLKKIKDSKNK